MEGHTVCGLGDAASWPINGLLTHFPDVVRDRCEHPENYNPEKYFQVCMNFQEMRVYRNVGVVRSFMNNQF